MKEKDELLEKLKEAFNSSDEMLDVLKKLEEMLYADMPDYSLNKDEYYVGTAKTNNGHGAAIFFVGNSATINAQEKIPDFRKEKNILKLLAKYSIEANIKEPMNIFLFNSYAKGTMMKFDGDNVSDLELFREMKEHERN